MKIQVTEEHIRQGRPRNAITCPVALACVAAGMTYVLVGYSLISFDRKRYLWSKRIRVAQSELVHNFNNPIR